MKRIRTLPLLLLILFFLVVVILMITLPNVWGLQEQATQKDKDDVH